MGTRSAVRVVALVAFAAIVGALTAGAAHGRAALECSSTARDGAVTGAVIQVLHSSVFVGDRYVGAAPFDVRVNNRICTDARGEVVFRLTSSSATITCIALPGSRAVVSSTLDVERGSSWCVVRTGTAGFGVRGRGVRVKSDTLFGITVSGRAVVVKVAAGAVYDGSLRVARARQQATFNGVWSRTDLVLSADDRVAIAQLSTAIAKQG